jgi:hypothetical protein
VSSRHRRCKGYQLLGIFIGLLAFLSLGSGARSQGTGVPADDPRPRAAAPGRHVLVQAGRLSVDLQEADLGEVLAQIGRQAGIRITPGPSAGKRISLRFAGVELEEGLRRLLRAASLSHLFLYAQGPTGGVTVAEVRVFGEGKEPSPRPSSDVEPRRPVDDLHPGAAAGRKPRRPGTEVVEPVQTVVSEPESEEPTELTRRIREVFQQSQAMGGSRTDDQVPSTHEPVPAGEAPGGVGGLAR